jgi:hypothetical protein
MTVTSIAMPSPAWKKPEFCMMRGVPMPPAASTTTSPRASKGCRPPILPTTPFLLAAAACYYKSSPRLHRWLLNNKYFGEYIRNYTEGKGLTAKTKVTALTVLWATISISIVFALPRLLPITFVLPLQIIMIAMAAAVSVHILRLPTYRKA